jgi:hypothetical protein
MHLGSCHGEIKTGTAYCLQAGPQAQRLPPAAALEFRWLSLPPPREAAAAGGGGGGVRLACGKPRPNQNAGAGEVTCNKPYNSAMAPPALFKNFGKASADLFKDDDWSESVKRNQKYQVVQLKKGERSCKLYKHT